MQDEEVGDDTAGGGDAANPGGSNSQPLQVDSDSDDEPSDAREDKSVTPEAAAAPASPPGTTATSTGGSDDAIMTAAAVTMPTLPAGFNAAHPGVDGTARANSPQPPPPVVAQPGEIPQADATGAKFSEAEKPVFVLLKQGATPAQKQQLSDVLRELQARAPSFVRSGFRSVRIRRPGGYPLWMCQMHISARFSRAVTPRVCHARC